MNSSFKTLLIIQILFLLATDCLYFQLQEGTPKCFYEDTIQQQLIISYYEFYDQLNEQKYDQNAGILVQVTDSNNQLVYRSLLNQKEGRFLVFNKDSRYLKFCYQTTTSHWITQNQIIRFKIRIVQQQETDRQKQFDNSTKLQDLSQLVRFHESINAQTNLYIKKVNQEGSMNQKLLEQNEQINSKINFWTLLQIITLIVSVMIQTVSLGKFFRQNNII